MPRAAYEFLVIPTFTLHNSTRDREAANTRPSLNVKSNPNYVSAIEVKKNRDKSWSLTIDYYVEIVRAHLHIWNRQYRLRSQNLKSTRWRETLSFTRLIFE
jgi:hypothetical protein